MSHRFLFLGTSLLLVGCVGVAKFPTIEPISFRPKGTSPQSAIVVRTTQPRFSWKPAAGVSSYDMAIWRVGADGGVGEVEYYFEGIEGTEHTPAHALLPGDYFWSVKPHGSTVWATASFTNVNPLFVSWGRGQPFRIRVVAR